MFFVLNEEIGFAIPKEFIYFLYSRGFVVGFLRFSGMGLFYPILLFWGG